MNKEVCNVTLREWIHGNNTSGEDIDVDVDGTSCYMCICFGDGIKLTPEGEEKFKSCLDNLRVQGTLITSDKDEDYDNYDEGKPSDIGLAEEFVQALAGYCSEENYKKWFEGETAEFI